MTHTRLAAVIGIAAVTAAGLGAASVIRVSPAQATSLGSRLPAGATVSSAQHRITFSGMTVRLTVLASPAGGPDERFRVAGMVNRAIVVQAGARQHGGHQR